MTHLFYLLWCCLIFLSPFPYLLKVDNTYASQIGSEGVMNECIGSTRTSLRHMAMPQ